MADQEIKVRITTDASGAVTGFSRVRDEMKKTQSDTETMASKISGSWLAVSAAIAGAAVAANQAWGLLKAGAEYSEQEGVLNNLTQKYKMTADSMVQSMARASEGMVSNADLMQVAVGGLAKGLNPDQLINLADAAKILADTTGKDTTTALTELTAALETGRAKGLRGYAGATLDLGDAFGELESKLTAAERVQAMYLLTMTHATKLQKEQTKAVDGTMDSIERIEAKYKNMVSWMARAWKTAVVSVAEGVEGYADLWHIMLGKKGTTGPNVYEVPPINSEKDNLAEYNAQMAAIKKAAASRVKPSGKKIDTDKAIDAQWKSWMETVKEISRAEDDLFKQVDEGTKKSLESIIRNDKERGEAARNLYKDMAGYEEEYYDESLKLTESQAAAYRAFGLDELAITKWVEEEKRKIRLQRDRRTSSSSAGWAQGIDDWTKDLKTEFERGEDMAKTTATSMSGSFSNLFFDTVKGELKDFRSYWESFMDAILRKCTDNIANMVTQWIMGMAQMQGSTGGAGGLGGLFSGIFGLGGGAAGAGGAIDLAEFIPYMYHGGGVVGGDNAPSRSMPAIAWAGAPRYHKGFMPEEYPAILKRGEGVFTPAQMAALGARSKESGPTNINIYAWDSRSLDDFVRRNAGIFQGINTKGLQNNRTRTEWKKLLA